MYGRVYRIIAYGGCEINIIRKKFDLCIKENGEFKNSPFCLFFVAFFYEFDVALDLCLQLVE